MSSGARDTSRKSFTLPELKSNSGEMETPSRAFSASRLGKLPEVGTLPNDEVMGNVSRFRIQIK